MPTCADSDLCETRHNLLGTVTDGPYRTFAERSSCDTEDPRSLLPISVSGGGDAECAVDPIRSFSFPPPSGTGSGRRTSVPPSYSIVDAWSDMAQYKAIIDRFPALCVHARARKAIDDRFAGRKRTHVGERRRRTSSSSRVVSEGRAP